MPHDKPGEHEARLRQLREQRYGKSQARAEPPAKPQPEQLRQLIKTVAKAAARKKPKAKKRRKAK